MASGAIPVDISGDLSSQSGAQTQGGNIGPIVNFTGSGMGIVKMLTLAGVTLLIIKILRK